MTKREAAIVSAHTKILCGEMIDLIKYLSELEGKSVFDCEANKIVNKHKDKIKRKCSCFDWVDYYGEKGHLIDNETELELAIDNDFEIIQRDLNRLEKLKKAINIIVEKMGIEIIDNGFSYIKQDIGLIKFLNEEESKLLKEVLSSERY